MLAPLMSWVYLFPLSGGADEQSRVIWPGARLTVQRGPGVVLGWLLTCLAYHGGHS